MGHHLEWFSVDNGFAMAMLLLKKTWSKFSDFQKKWHFSSSNRIYSILWFKFKISALKLVHVQNFSQIGQKIKDLEFRAQMIPKTA